MRYLSLLLLLGCGHQSMTCPSDVFIEIRSDDDPIDCEEVYWSLDLVRDLMIKAEVLTEDQFNTWYRDDYLFVNKDDQFHVWLVVRVGGFNDWWGNITVGRDLKSLMHEMLHTVEDRRETPLSQNALHIPWDDNGYDLLQSRYRSRIRPWERY